MITRKLSTRYALFYELSCWSSEEILKSFILICIEKKRKKLKIPTDNIEIIIRGEPLFEEEDEDENENENEEKLGNIIKNQEIKIFKNDQKYIKIDSPLTILNSHKFKLLETIKEGNDNSIKRYMMDKLEINKMKSKSSTTNDTFNENDCQENDRNHFFLSNIKDQDDIIKTSDENNENENYQKEKNEKIENQDQNENNEINQLENKIDSIENSKINPPETISIDIKNHKNASSKRPSISISRKRIKKPLISTKEFNDEIGEIQKEKEKERKLKMEMEMEMEIKEIDEITAQNTLYNSKLQSCDLSINIIYKDCKRPKSPEKLFSKTNNRKKRIDDEEGAGKGGTKGKGRVNENWKELQSLELINMTSNEMEMDYFKASKVTWFPNERNDQRNMEISSLNNENNENFINGTCLKMEKQEQAWKLNEEINEKNEKNAMKIKCKSILKNKNDHFNIFSNFPIRLNHEYERDENGNEILEKEIIEIKKIIYKDDIDYVYINRGTKSRPKKSLSY